MAQPTITAETVTLTVNTDALRETMIALRDRYHSLLPDMARNDVVGIIAGRQVARVVIAHNALAEALGERFI